MQDRTAPSGFTTFLRLLRYLKPYRLATGLALVSMTAAAGLDVVRPLLVREIVDRVIVAGELGSLPPLVGALLAVAVAMGGATFALTYLRRYVGEHVTRDVRRDLYRKLHYLDASFHDEMPTGELISRTSTDVQALRRLMGYALLTGLRLVATAVFVLVIGITLSPPMTAVILLCAPGLWLTVRHFQRQIRPAFQAVHEQNANLATALAENITGVRVVRSFGQETAEEHAFGTENRRTLLRHVTAARIRSRHAPIITFWTYLARILLLVVGGWLVITDRTTLGTLVAFDGYLLRIITPMREAPVLIDAGGEAISSAERIFGLLDEPRRIADPPQPARPAGVRGKLHVEGVGFGYNGVPVLRGVDLTVRPGETVAVVGPTGAGKSTLVRLLQRAYDPDSGSIVLDGRDLRNYSLQQLRRAVSVIPQESFLFSTTIAENIAYGRPEASPEEIEDAARRAQAHEFISRLPEGYRTRVGERGAGLSGGQKQRITIARALVSRPAILVVDDATSAVDTETELAIWNALGDVMARTTTLVVAQRLVTLRRVDRVFVVERGRIVEAGTHDDLVAQGGAYARMVALQQDTDAIGAGR